MQILFLISVNISLTQFKLNQIYFKNKYKYIFYHFDIYLSKNYYRKHCNKSDRNQALFSCFMLYQTEYGCFTLFICIFIHVATCIHPYLYSRCVPHLQKQYFIARAIPSKTTTIKLKHRTVVTLKRQNNFIVQTKLIKHYSPTHTQTYQTYPNLCIVQT